MLSIVLIVFLLSRCIQRDAEKKGDVGISYKNYAGSEACRSCHNDIVDSHLQTFHHQTSAFASPGNVRGNTEPGKNRFYFRPDLYISVERKDDSLFQNAWQQGELKISRPLDFVIGSGKKGQTYLYWHENSLFQLPLTYFTATNEWTNSPGYTNKVQFNRPITSRCLECHSTYFEKVSKQGAKTEEFSRSPVLVGVECEKCHGPAKEHVSFHEKNPGEKQARFVINPSKLTRTQSLDLCRLCHGGRLTKSKPSFSFVAGDKLSDYFTLDSLAKDVSDIDVHGNQFGMLSASKCFTMSSMTCSSCHSPHQNESGQKTIFATRCMNCHSGAEHTSCKLTGVKTADFLQQNCIDCHMPELRSQAIVVLRQGQTIPTPAFMRTHFITIYKDEIKKILAKEAATQKVN
jgi:hypothetical protein